MCQIEAAAGFVDLFTYYQQLGKGTKGAHGPYGYLLTGYTDCFMIY